jgi:predicted transposase/invertase (TIGR01784 family)
VLGLPEDERGQIGIIDTNSKVDSSDEGPGILDVYIETENGARVDVKIQVISTPFAQEQVTAYTAKMLADQMKICEALTDKKKSVAVFILTYNLIQDSESFHNNYMFYDAKTESLFTHMIEIHTLELQKLPAVESVPGADEKTARQILWLRLIKAEEEEEVELLAAQNPEIKDAYGILKELSKSEDARRLYESRDKTIRDELARLCCASKDGFAKGIIEGVEEGRRLNALDTARKLIEIGLDADKITLVTGLTVEEIQNSQSPPVSSEPVAKKRGRPRKTASPGA